MNIPSFAAVKIWNYYGVSMVILTRGLNVRIPRILMYSLTDKETDIATFLPASFVYNASTCDSLRSTVCMYWNEYNGVELPLR